MPNLITQTARGEEAPAHHRRQQMEEKKGTRECRLSLHSDTASLTTGQWGLRKQNSRRPGVLRETGKGQSLSGPRLQLGLSTLSCSPLSFPVMGSELSPPDLTRSGREMLQEPGPGERGRSTYCRIKNEREGVEDMQFMREQYIF